MADDRPVTDNASDDKVIALYDEGIFLHAYDADAEILSSLTGYKLVRTKRSGRIRKRCGFPYEALDRVEAILKKQGLTYTISSANKLRYSGNSSKIRSGNKELNRYRTPPERSNGTLTLSTID